MANSLIHIVSFFISLIGRTHWDLAVHAIGSIPNAIDVICKHLVSQFDKVVTPDMADVSAILRSNEENAILNLTNLEVDLMAIQDSTLEQICKEFGAVGVKSENPNLSVTTADSSVEEDQPDEEDQLVADPLSAEETEQPTEQDDSDDKPNPIYPMNLLSSDESTEEEEPAQEPPQEPPQEPATEQAKKPLVRVIGCGKKVVRKKHGRWETVPNYSKKVPCPYCDVKTSKMARHITTIHANEDDVKQLTQYPVGSKRRREELILLKNKGTFCRNVEALKNGGDFYVARRPPRGKLMYPEDFLPCTFCYGFYIKTEL